MTDKTKEFIQKLKDSGYWNDEYDYSKVEYVNSKTKVIIIDKKFGTEHKIKPNNILSQGFKPSIRNAVDRNEYLVNQFREVHGEWYDYSKANYVGNGKVKTTIICPEHGEFEQSVAKHIFGQGCTKCGGNEKDITTERFLQKLKDSGYWNDEYDYSKVNYVNGNTKVIVIDIKLDTEHLITPTKLLVNNKCTIQNAVDQNEYLIKRFEEVHGGRYDYSKVEYVNSYDNVIIICPEHGEFEQTPTNHRRGAGCRECGGNKPLTTEGVIEQFKEVHGEGYDYSKVRYSGIDNKVIIICPEHGGFEQTPYDHRKGAGCSICNRGWNRGHLIRFFSDMEKGRDILLMDSMELMRLIEQGKLPREVQELVFEMDDTGDNTLRDLKDRVLGEDGTEEPTTQSGETDTTTDTEEGVETPQRTQTEDEEVGEEPEPTLPTMGGIDDLLVLDNEMVVTCDDETVEFFISHRLNKYWNGVINGERDVNELIGSEGGVNFQTTKQRFLEEYQEVMDYQVPEGYNFRDKNGKLLQPFMMQKLTVLRVKNYRRYGNWSGTGAGKTNAFIITSREIDSRLTLVVGLNATINQLGEDILSVFPDSVIHTRYSKGTTYDRSKHNYLLLNYEKFQQDYSEGLFQDLNDNNQIDFVVIDEVHNVKQRTTDDESIRRGTLMRLVGRAEETNPNLHLLAMSATPVINNLTEAKSLLHMTTGEEYNDIHNRSTISNAIRVFSHLTRNGIRYRPNYDIKVNELSGENTPHLRIDGMHLIDRLVTLSNTDYVGVERTLLDDKLNAVFNDIDKGTIMYSYYTDDGIIPRLIADHIKRLGFSYGLYTGEVGTSERVSTLNDFIDGKIDVLITSGPISTGVDGLQKVSNKIIITTLPWTDANYVQLKGRLQRTGSIFKEVDIIIPQIHIEYDGEPWSLDSQRLAILRNKRTIADAAVDGVLPSQSMVTMKGLHTEAFKSLAVIKERLELDGARLSQRNKLTFPLRPEVVETMGRKLGDFSEMNRTWSISKSTTTHDRLKKDPMEWYYYHTLYAESRKSWLEIPFVEIAKKLKGRPDWIVGDFGCGENLLAKEVDNKVHGFDHVAINDSVVSCDITNVPLEDGVLDVAVFSLSLMGTNYKGYFQEAYRTLKSYGNIFVCEPAAKWEGREEQLKAELEVVGFKCFGTIRNTDKFIYVDGVKY